MAREALDHRGGRLLVGAHDAAQVLGVEALREIRRAHQVAEHHGELAALGLGGGSAAFVSGAAAGVSEAPPIHARTLPSRAATCCTSTSSSTSSVEGVVVELELAREAAQRDAAIALQERPGVLHGLEEGHRPYGTRGRWPRIGAVSAPTWVLSSRGS